MEKSWAVVAMEVPVACHWTTASHDQLLEGAEAIYTQHAVHMVNGIQCSVCKNTLPLDSSVH